MGHYHRIVNLTRHLVIEPMDAGDLDKLVEFGHSSGTAMTALWLLQSSGEATYETSGDRVRRPMPPWTARASTTFGVS